MKRSAGCEMSHYKVSPQKISRRKAGWVKGGVVLLSLCSLMLLSGCWDLRYLNKLAIASAIGIDEDPSGKSKMQLTVQVVLTNNVSSSNKEASNSGAITTFTETGDTVFEAIRKMSEKTSRRLFFSHTQMLLISEKIARKEIYPYFDMIERNPDIRSDIPVAVARGVTAKELLETTTLMESIPIYHMRGETEVSEKAYGVIYEITVQELIRMNDRGRRQAVAPTYRLRGNRETSNKKSNLDTIPPQSFPELDTMAVFRGGKLIGYLQTKESRGLSWTQNKVTSTVVKLACPKSDGHLIIEIIKANSKTKATADPEGKPVINIDLHLQGSIREIMCGDLDILEESTFNQIRKLTNEAVKDEVSAAINRLQKSLKSDALGWGQVIYRQQPHIWKRIEYDWEELFPNVKSNINCSTSILGSGARNNAAME